MTQREREFLSESSIGDRDPHSFLFGDDDDDDAADLAPARQTRADRRRSEQGHGRRHRRRGLLFVLLAAVLVAAVALLVVPRVIDYFAVPDYSGGGTGAVSITINAGDSASVIAATLKSNGVVKSTKAFTDAASNNSASQSIQPGVYTVKLHMSGKAALDALLATGSRTGSNDLLVTEGATTLDVKARLLTMFGASQSAAITAAFSPGSDSNLPLNYTGKGDGVPTSVEGFLYPATYTIDRGSSPQRVIQTMVTRYLAQDREMSFAIDAKKISLTPYQALIVASIAQSEAKYPEDMPKVVRTILNRLATKTPLQFDSTSSYACKLAGTAASKCIYHQVDSPYNTYTHQGLPPTPIDNPGADALSAAVHPAAGNYLFFVNQDAAGHLFFTNDAKAFATAARKCAENNWGCG